VEIDQQHRTFLPDLENVLGTAARIFGLKGCDVEVAILTYSTPNLESISWYNWNGSTEGWELQLACSSQLYEQISERRDEYCKSIKSILDLFTEPFPNDYLERVRIFPAIVEDAEWRTKANEWLRGAKSNQGRVRSDNVAPLSADGLLFRSQPEINFYHALKSKGISFSPLPVFVRGGSAYHRLEPDFVVVYEGLIFIVEIDGDSFHPETPAEAHARTKILQNEGCIVERIQASTCNSYESARREVETLIQSIKKSKMSR